MRAAEPQAFGFHLIGCSMGSHGWCLLVLVLSGCLPIPHMHRTGPGLNGQLSDENGPLSNVRVRRVADFTAEEVRTNVACAKAGDEMRTDARGRFTFESVSRFEPVIPLYGDPVWHTLLCFDTGRAEMAAWKAGPQIGSTPTELSLSCSVAKDGTVRCSPDHRQ